MKSILHFIILLLTFGCAAGMVRIDKKFFKESMTWKFKKSKKECFNAVKKSITNHNLKIKKTSFTKGYIQSNRGVLTAGVNANQHTASTYVVKSELLFKITGNNKQCKIETKRFKIWENNKRIKVGNKYWIDQYVVNAFKDDIKDILYEESNEFEGDDEFKSEHGEEEDF